MKKCLLDSSFVIDLLNEMADDSPGSAFAWLQRNEKAQLWISPVTLAEVLEGATDPRVVEIYLAGILAGHSSGSTRGRVALRQKRSARRLGENDAWQCALAEQMDAAIVGHDPAAFHRLGARYIDHRKPATS